MAQASKIEWTDGTWNPVRGCSRVSEGCRNCYAEKMSARFSKPGLPFEGVAEMTALGPQWTNRIRLVEELVDAPLRWRLPRTIFANSMSDLFHESVPLQFIQRVFDVMTLATWHRFQVLTKRSRRLLALNKQLEWAPNIWMGVSVESSDHTERIQQLRGTDAAIRFLSLEPLLGPLADIRLDGIHWVIVGGESGPGARPMNQVWVTQIRDRCLQTDVPFFFKQWGGTNKKENGRQLEGRTWDEIPTDPPRQLQAPLSNLERLPPK